MSRLAINVCQSHGRHFRDGRPVKISGVVFFFPYFHTIFASNAVVLFSYSRDSAELEYGRDSSDCILEDLRFGRVMRDF